MRKLATIWFMAFCLPGTGCHLALNGCRSVTAEIARRADERKECERNRELAAEIWNDIQARSAGFSWDYGLGFQDGFVDYLDAGGTGQPPTLPPRRYRTFAYQNPAGYQALDDWYAGFRHGAAVAADSGYRKYIVMSPKLAGVPGGPGCNVSATPPAGLEIMPPLQGPSAQPNTEFLPPLPLGGAPKETGARTLP